MSDRCTISRAYGFAVADLRTCYEDFGIVAGRHHYDDYWTRDAAFGWKGALALYDHEIVWRHLVFLSRLQRKDGMVPFLVRRHLSPLSIAGIKIKACLRPKFRSHKALWTSQVIDSNPWFSIGIADLLRSDIETARFAGFAGHNRKALEWCLQRVGSDGLVKEGFLAGWNDGILKSGATLLNNILFYHALDLWRFLDPRFSAAADRIKTALQQKFFNGRYFIDWIDRRNRRHEYFESLGNFLAILWGVADKNQGQTILDFAFSHVLSPSDKVVKIAYPDYPTSLVDPGNRVVGLGDYWGGRMYWLEPSLLFVRALAKVGMEKESRMILEDVAALICKYRGVYEVYERVSRSGEGKKVLEPVRRWNYRSEHPFARSAGLFILACGESGGTCR